MTKQQATSRRRFAPNAYAETLKRQRTAFFLVFGFSAVVNILMLTGSIYMLQVYDRVLSSGSVPTLLGLFTIVVALYGFFGLFDFLRSRLLSRIAVRLDLALGSTAFKAWLRTGRQGAAESGADTDTPQLMRQLDTVRNFLSGPTATTLFDVPFVPIFVFAMFLIHPWLGMMVIAGAALTALMALTGWLLTRKMQRRNLAIESQSQEFSGQSYASADTIAAMGMQGHVTAHWQQMHMSALATHQKVSNPSGALASSSKTFRMLLQSAILTVGALLVLQNQISAGMIIASSVLSSRALAPIDQMIGQWRSIGLARAAHRSLSSFFNNQPQIGKYVDLPAPSGRLAVSQLTKFAPTSGAKTPVALLKGIQFELEPGDGLGVIGKSGSGKSTLARMLVGAWQADKGDIRFDGAPHDQWDPDVLGKSIGYLPQKVDLLPGTIGQNIARFDPQAKDSDVIAAARMAGIHELILTLPEGYTTPVGNRNSTPLSGGQIQRLGLARAVFGTPRIVVLDEPNANLDADGDEALGNAIKALRDAGSTVIVMAHRPSAIAAVNKVMILHEGRVARFDDKDKVLGPPKAVTPAAEVTHFPGRPSASGAANQPGAQAKGNAVSAIPGFRTAPQNDTVMAETRLARILKAERQLMTGDNQDSAKVYESV